MRGVQDPRRRQIGVPFAVVVRRERDEVSADFSGGLTARAPTVKMSYVSAGPTLDAASVSRRRLRAVHAGAASERVVVTCRDTSEPKLRELRSSSTPYGAFLGPLAFTAASTIDVHLELDRGVTGSERMLTIELASDGVRTSL